MYMYIDNWFSTKIQFGIGVCLQYPASWLQYIAFNMYNVDTGIGKLFIYVKQEFWHC